MSDTEPRRARDVTRDDVARLAGVSSAVVSYVVNNGPRPVAEATRARVQEAIDKLGYRPNAAARSLITGRSDLLGLIVPDLRNPYFAALAQAVEVVARREGMNLVLAQGVTAHIEPLVETLAGHLVTGIITATTPEPEALALAVRSRVPMVRMSLASRTDRQAIWPDYYGGARSAVHHLVDVHGCRSVALVIGSDHPDRPDEPRDDRERGWRDALETRGLPADQVVRVYWGAAGGREAAGQLLARYPGADAVFVSADQQAIGLVAGLHEAGVAVPDRIAVASFDGSPEAAFTVPPLTTAGVPMAAMAEAAVAAVLGNPPETRAFATELIVRRSCGCGPGAPDAGRNRG